MSKPLMDNAEMRKRLRKLTSGRVNMSSRSPLSRAIKSGIIDWCVNWTEDKFPQRGLAKTDVMTDREINSLTARVYHSLRGTVW